MKEQTIEVLRETRDLLSETERWCRGAAAVMPLSSYLVVGEWETCAPADDHACKWCLTGAIRCVMRNRHDDELLQRCFWALNDTLSIVTENSVEETLQRWNDNQRRVHADVLCLLDTTITNVERSR